MNSESDRGWTLHSAASLLEWRHLFYSTDPRLKKKGSFFCRRPPTPSSNLLHPGCPPSTPPHPRLSVSVFCLRVRSSGSGPQGSDVLSRGLLIFVEECWGGGCFLFLCGNLVVHARMCLYKDSRQCDNISQTYGGDGARRLKENPTL